MKNVRSTIAICLLLLPIVAQGQSEFTHLYSTGQMGYRGRVQTVQRTDLCMDAEHKLFVTTAEVYNQSGMRTAMSTVGLQDETDERYEHLPDGRLHLFVSSNNYCVDSVVYVYDSLGCLFGFSEYLISKTEDDNSVTDNLITCDDHCRPLVQVNVWGDSTVYRYDSLGRPVYKTIPGAVERYSYDADGRLTLVRSGKGRYLDFHIRYDERGDTAETWYSDWEQDLPVRPTVLIRNKYTYTDYDDHGNWTKATIDVIDDKEQHAITVVRTFSYYD